MPAIAPEPPIAPFRMRRPRWLQRLRKTQRESSLSQSRKKRKMSMVTRERNGTDDVGLEDTPMWGCDLAGSSSAHDERTEKRRWYGNGLA